MKFIITNAAKPENKLINDMLYRVFKSERVLLPNISLPFGVSLLTVAEVKTTNNA